MAVRTETLRIVFCWAEVSGYMPSCWRALAARPGVSVHVLHPDSIASEIVNPFDLDALMTGVSHEMFRADRPDLEAWLLDAVVAQQPSVVVHCGWIVRAYRSLLSSPQLRDVPMMLGMDSPWLGRVPQRLAHLRLRRFVDRMRLVVVAGDRSAEYARRIGFDERNVRSGYYGFDDAQLAPVAAQRPADWPRRFLFVGRYVDQKDLPYLMRAYTAYRRMVSDPWPLTCCGTGPEGTWLRGVEGVEDWGFQQPAALPGVLARHGVFVMASKFEPWGVVIAEAAASGMPVVCSTACGAAVEIVRPYYNGLTVAPGDVEGLARAMAWMHEHPDLLREMGRRGRQLALPHTAESWAERWHNYALDATRPL